MPRATVLIPAYQPNLLWFSEVIEDLNAQHFKDFEVLVVDDGSSPALEEAWMKERMKATVHVHRQPKNRGIVEALNAGLKRIDSEYILRMDADDRMHPDRFSRQIQFMDQHSDVGISGTGAVRFGQRRDAFRLETHHASIVTELLFTNPMIHPTVCMRSESISGMRYPNDVAQAEDYLFWAMAAALGVRFANLELPLLRYRVSGSNSSAVNKAKRFERYMKVQRNVYRTLFGNTLPPFIQSAFESGLHASLGGMDQPQTFTLAERIAYARSLHGLASNSPAFTDVDLTLNRLLEKAEQPQSWVVRKWLKIRDRYSRNERLDWS